MIRFPETGAVLGICGCGQTVRVDSFSERLGLLEWYLSSMCAQCQSRTFLGLDPAGVLPPSPIRFGVIAAQAYHHDEVCEVAFMPFRFVPEFHVLAWEARFTLRLGTLLDSQWHADLEPMSRILKGHWVRVTDLPSFRDPRLDEWFYDLDLLLALDQASAVSILRTCPALAIGAPHVAALADEVPWPRLTGHPLLPFEAFVRAQEFDFRPSGARSPRSALSQCACTAAALALPDPASPDDERTALWHLFESMKRLFARSDPAQGD